MKSVLLFFVAFFCIADGVAGHAAIPWEYVGPDTALFTAMHSFGGGHVIAATRIPNVGPRRPIYISRNHGKTWDTLCMGGGLERYEITNFAQIGGKLYACLDSRVRSEDDGRQESGTFYCSEDSGATWKYVQWKGGTSYWAIGKDSLILAGSKGYVCKSSDGGTTWKKHTVGAAVCHSIAQYGDTLYCGTNSGLFVSFDWGETWGFRGADLARIYTLYFLGDILFTGENIGVLYHRNFGFGKSSTWTRSLNSGVGNDSKAFPIKDSIVYAHHNIEVSFGVIGSKMYYSTDSAKTFTRFWLVNDTTYLPKIYRFFSDSIYAYALTYKGIYRRLIYDNTHNTHNTLPVKSNQSMVRVWNTGIEVTTTPGTGVAVSLHALNGKIVKNLHAGAQHTPVAIYPVPRATIAAGLYVVVIKAGTGMFVERVLVSR